MTHILIRKHKRSNFATSPTASRRKHMFSNAQLQFKMWKEKSRRHYVHGVSLVSNNESCSVVTVAHPCSESTSSMSRSSLRRCMASVCRASADSRVHLATISDSIGMETHSMRITYCFAIEVSDLDNHRNSCFRNQRPSLARAYKRAQTL